MDMKHQATSSPHVLIIPHPLHGHVTPMLQLAELFCLANFKVTFITSTYNHQRLARYNDIEGRFARYEGFRFKTTTDGLPADHLRAGQKGAEDVVQGFTSNAEPLIKEMLSSSRSTSGLAHATPVTCLIIDGFLRFAHDVANEAEVPVIVFRCFSACCSWIYFCIPELIQTGLIPFKDEDMDRQVQNVPGMDSFLRCRDLPLFCRVKDVSSCHGLQQKFAAERQRTQQTHALILNTFEDLEGPILSLIRSHFAKIYSIGPLHSHLNHRLSLAKTTLSNNNSSSGLWKVDRSCISWLDQKPDKSVVYASFGSLTILRREQLVEIWAGLVQSKKYFLWVVRPDMIIGSRQDCPTPDELMESTKDRGYMVGWAPQEEVLAHRAVGGFLTHSGWNSTLESIIAGVPMLCWPYFGDQPVTSRYVTEVCRIGLDMKDTCDRNIVEKMINELMDTRKDELARSMSKVSHLAKRSVIEGGSSYCNLDHLIQDIKQMAMTEEH